MRDSLNLHSSTLLAKSMILPYLDYGCLFFSSCSSKSLNRLQTLQNRILKCALRKNSLFGTRMLHKSAGVLLINDRIRFNQLTLIQHDFMNGSNIFERQAVVNVNTRSTVIPTLTLSRPSTEQYRRSLFYNGVKDWNNIPLELKQSLSLQTFKIKLKRQIMSTYDPILEPNQGLQP